MSYRFSYYNSCTCYFDTGTSEEDEEEEDDDDFDDEISSIETKDFECQTRASLNNLQNRGLGGAKHLVSYDKEA